MERIAGQRFVLDVMRQPDEGPWYPHVAEEKTENSYRFFAGRLAGVAPSEQLPAGHAVASPDADSWEFEAEEPDGSWIALKFDRRRDQVSITSDLFLLQRWYYTCQEGAWYLSNSLLYLQRVLKGKLEVEQRAVPYMLQFGYVPFQFTPLKDVFALCSGRVLVMEGRESRLFVRARIPIHRRPHVKEADASAQIGAVLCEAVASELRGTDSIVLPLSGGVDSRFLLGCALEILPREHIRTITYGQPRSLDFAIGTGLAKKLGVACVALPMDRRPIGEILHENFAHSEGKYWTYPDYPVSFFRDALPRNSCVLSGHNANAVFGSYEIAEDNQTAEQGDEAKRLLALVREATFRNSPVKLNSLLQISTPDPLGFEAIVLEIPGADLREKYEYWAYEDHFTNRTNFAVELHRDRAFYLAPFVHCAVMDVAYALPADKRRGEKAYFTALKEAFPELYAYPTKSHFGFPLGRRMNLQILVARAWRKAWSEIDEMLGRPLGVILYHHPRTNYAHPRELSKKIHRSYVVECLESLKSLDVFRPQGLDDLKNRYL
ncbi:MAG: asparagine synthase-related protein, partial [bacterium]